MPAGGESTGAAVIVPPLVCVSVLTAESTECSQKHVLLLWTHNQIGVKCLRRVYLHNCTQKMSQNIFIGHNRIVPESSLSLCRNISLKLSSRNWL